MQFADQEDHLGDAVRKDGDRSDSSDVLADGITTREDRSTGASNTNDSHNDNIPTKSKKNKKNKNKKKKKKTAGVGSGEAASLARVPVRVTAMNVQEALKSSTDIEKWYSAYQEAFAEENEFIDALQQASAASSSSGHKSSSRSLGLGGTAMMPLVFLLPGKEAHSQFRRACFCALVGRKGAGSLTAGQQGCEQGEEAKKDYGQDTSSESVVAWATVDEDVLNPGGVCHVRMLLVAPSHQRRGIGRQLLEHIEQHFRSRHLGLKYANCHDYAAFYGSVGFRVIGCDECYTYMAIRR